MQRLITLFNLIIIQVLLAFPITGCTTGAERIAFIGSPEGDSSNYVYIMNLERSERIQLARYDPFIAQHYQMWSADGKTLAYYDYNKDTAESWLCVVDSNGKKRRRILDITDMRINSISLSPDGKKILLSLDVSRTIETPMYQTVHVEVTYDSDLYSVDVSTGNLNRITDTPDIWELYPVFSPDCSKIAFVVRIDTETMKNVPQDIYIMNADGSSRVKLAHHKYGIYVFQGLHWSPDGRKIVYTVINPITDYNDMFLINLENNSFIDFNENLHIRGNYPSWSPDSSKISFSSGNATGVNKICIMDIYTQNITELYQSSGYSCWSPDGSEIAFRNRFNVYEFLAIGIDGENSRTLISSEDTGISNPIWFSR